MKRFYLLMMMLVGTFPLMASCSENDSQPEIEQQPLEPSGDTKTLVAYFSATGNTERIAKRIAELTGADIYFIQPSKSYAKDPYDDSQLIQDEAYNDLRPAVSNLPSKEEIAKYDTLYIGSPLWWHQPAMVVCTFLEEYDLKDKVVIPFITYGAKTYLNEAMQKIYKLTSTSTHIPANLPEDIAPENIREPQNGSSNDVRDWLHRNGIMPY